ncbi:MAG TPA: hypothetical protein PLK12_10595 [Prolixibacteraceae bacterium]|nr:hypothetical protein [Prolixibacteraceae bacterium]
MKYTRFLLIGILVLSFHLAQAQGAVYGGEGWGAVTEGGRGGAILRVTNLNGSGPGSLYAALQARGRRIVVFEVGGVINLSGIILRINNPYITIAAQTAPSPGITLVNGSLNISTNDVILQHIMIRPGSGGHETGWEPDGLSTVGANNVLIDHCSFSWAVDENCSASGDRFKGNNPEEWRMNTSHDITISNCIIAEGLSYATHSKGQHSMGSLIHDNATNIAVIKNLYASNNDRNPLFKAGAMGVVVNNYIYNPGSAAIRYSEVESEWEGHEIIPGKMTVMGNVLQLGPSSKSIPLLKAGNGSCSIYMSENLAKDIKGGNIAKYSGLTENRVSEPPIWCNNIDVIPCRDVKDVVLEAAGARPWNRDPIDARIVQSAIDGTGKIINSEAEVGGLPFYPPTEAPFFVEEWNLDYMLPLMAGLVPFNVSETDTLLCDSVYTIGLADMEIAAGFLFVELLVDGLPRGVRTEAPYTWDFLSDEPGDYLLTLIGKNEHFEYFASKNTYVTVVENRQNPLENDMFPDNDVPEVNIYPNPFHGQTTIRISLKKREPKVNLSVRNSLGAILDILYQGALSPGIHTFNWQTENGSQGICFLRLETGSDMLVRKMVGNGK